MDSVENRLTLVGGSNSRFHLLVQNRCLFVSAVILLSWITGNPAGPVVAAESGTGGVIEIPAYAYDRGVNIDRHVIDTERVDVTNNNLVACAAAALKCTKPGARSGIPTEAELKRFLKSNTKTYR